MRYAWIEEPPFNFVAPEGADGIDVALMRAACQALGEPLHLVRTEFAELLPGLQAGMWEVTAAMFITPERTKLAAFTRPVWRLADGLLVKATLAGQIVGYGSLARLGLRLAVLEGQVQEQTALRCGIRQSNLRVYPDYASAAAAVLDGTIDAYASVALAHRAMVSRHAGLACVTVSDAERPHSFGAFACATVEIRMRLEAGLDGLVASPAHHKLMSGFGLGPAEWP